MSKYTGSGAKFYIGTGGDLTEATFALEDVLANVVSIGEQSVSVDEEEVTDLDSGDFKEFIPTLKDNGSFDIVLNATETNYTSIKGTDGQLQPMAIEHPNLTDLNGKFMGWISSSRGEFTKAGVVQFTITVRITGEIDSFTTPVA